MRIGIIGPTRIDKFCKVVNKQRSDFDHFLHKISEHLASTEHSLVVVPAQENASGIIAQQYRDLQGSKVYGIVPEDDEEFGLMDVDPIYADEIINCGTWRNQPEKLCEESDVLLCVGLAPGTIIEICYAKWFKVQKIFILIEFLSQRLAPEIEKDLPIGYVNFSELKEKIK